TRTGDEVVLWVRGGGRSLRGLSGYAVRAGNGRKPEHVEPLGPGHTGASWWYRKRGAGPHGAGPGRTRSVVDPSPPPTETKWRRSCTVSPGKQRLSPTPEVGRPTPNAPRSKPIPSDGLRRCAG